MPPKRLVGADEAAASGAYAQQAAADAGTQPAPGGPKRAAEKAGSQQKGRRTAEQPVGPVPAGTHARVRRGSLTPPPLQATASEPSSGNSSGSEREPEVDPLQARLSEVQPSASEFLTAAQARRPAQALAC